VAAFIPLYGVMPALFPYYLYENFKATPLQTGLIISGTIPVSCGSRGIFTGAVIFALATFFNLTPVVPSDKS